MSTHRDHAIVLKLSGEALSGAGRALEPLAFESSAQQILTLVRAGRRVGVVVGGGNLHRGSEPWGSYGLSRSASDELGMHSTALNAIALFHQLQHLDDELRVDVVAKRGPVRPMFSPWRRGLRGQGQSDVVIVAGGTGVGGVSTDVAAPMLAEDLGSTRIVMSKFGVDGIYSRDPRVFPEQARHLPVVTVGEALRRDLRFMDREAMSLCRPLQITVHVVPAADPDAITDLVLHGADIGSTMIPGSADDIADDTYPEHKVIRHGLPGARLVP